MWIVEATLMLQNFFQLVFCIFISTRTRLSGTLIMFICLFGWFFVCLFLFLFLGGFHFVFHLFIWFVFVGDGQSKEENLILHSYSAIRPAKNVYFPASKSNFPPVWTNFPPIWHISLNAFLYQSKAQNFPARSFLICLLATLIGFYDVKYYLNNEWFCQNKHVLLTLLQLFLVMPPPLSEWRQYVFAMSVCNVCLFYFFFSLGHSISW